MLRSTFVIPNGTGAMGAPVSLRAPRHRMT